MKFVLLFPLVCLFGLAACTGNLETVSPDELFSRLVLDSKTLHLERLQSSFESRHEFIAWFHFYATKDDLKKIRESLSMPPLVEAGEDMGYFDRAPLGLKPTTTAKFYKINSGYRDGKGVASELAFDEQTGETLLWLQHI